MTDAILVLASFLAGVYVGATLMRWRWERNWMEPYRLESTGSLYKVHRCDPDRAWESWKNMRLHEPMVPR